MRSDAADRTPHTGRLATLAVAATLIVACALAQHYVVHYGTAVAALDDLTQVRTLLDDFRPSLGWLWWQHNEHRIPLPRLLFWSLLRGAHDFRAATLVDLVLYCAIAAAFVWAARRIRGRTSLVDAFFPLAWLSWSHAENLLNSFQIVFVLPTAITCSCLIAFASLRGPPSSRTVTFIAASTVVLPLCGIVGVIQAPFLAFWLAWVWLGARHGESSRSASRIALAGALAGLAVAASTFLQFRMLSSFQRPTLGRILGVSAQFLAQPSGWVWAHARLWSAWGAALVFLVGLVVVARLARRMPEERARWLGILVVECGIGAVALSIGYGRGGDGEIAGTCGRYATISLPWISGLFLAACARDRSRSAHAAQWLLCGLAAWMYAGNLGDAAEYGQQRVRAALSLEGDVARGKSYPELAAGHWRDFYYGEAGYADVLRMLDSGGFAPFARPRGVDERLLIGQDPAEDRFRATPIVRSDFTPIIRDIDGLSILVVGPKTELEWEVPSDVTTVRGRFGIHPKSWSSGACDGLRFVVEMLDANGRVLDSFERDLDPVHVEADRGSQDFGRAFDRGEGRRLVLRTKGLTEGGEARGFAFWTDVRLR